MWKTIKTFNPFQNPFRLIHEVYVYRIWIREYRKQNPALNEQHERNERNLRALIMMAYIVMFIAFGYFIFITWFAEELIEVGMLS